MSNKNLFKSVAVKSKSLSAVNLAGAPAYELSAKEALAQFASCGTFNGTFYATPKDTLDQLASILPKVDPSFVAKVAVYSREKAWLKDMPAFLTAYLAATDVELAKKIFSRSIDNGKMIRNFAQMIRSGKLGRKSFGTAMKKQIEAWFDNASDYQVFSASIGNDPSLADVIKMVHPKPKTESRTALYAYLIGREYAFDNLPEVVKQFEAFKKDPENAEVPNIDFQFLTALNLSDKVWKKIAENAKWHNARMNINTFERHNVFNDTESALKLAKKLSDAEQIRKVRAFPYQLLATYLNLSSGANITMIKDALHDAMEIAVENVPDFGSTRIRIGVDISGSMGGAITGHSKVPSKVRHVDVAALIASVIKRRGSNVDTYVFDGRTKKVDIDGRDTIMTNVKKLSANGGSTNCASFIQKLNETNDTGEILFIVSDNMSWVEYYGHSYSGFGFNKNAGSPLVQEWKKYKARNPNAKLILLDVAPSTTTQAQSDKDVLNIAGWNDQMFGVISDFIAGKSGKDAWIQAIESIEL